MALQTPYGNLSTQPVLVMEMLAACEAWQEWCAENDVDFPAGAGREAAALAYIYFVRAPRYAFKHRTCNAAVFAVPRITLLSDCSDSLGDEFTPEGNVVVQIMRKIPTTFLLDRADYVDGDTPAPDDIEAEVDVILDGMAMMDFQGWADGGGGHGLGKIIEELLAQSGQNGNLVITKMDLIEGPGQFTPEAQDGDIGQWIGTTLLLRWGIPL